MASVQFNVSIEEKIVNKLKEIAKKEKEKLGYDITTSSIVRKAVTEFIENYEKQN